MLLSGLAVLSIFVSRWANNEPLLRSTNVYAQAASTVSVYVDGNRHSITTNAATVGDVIGEFHIVLHEGDVVEPGLDHPIDQPNYNVNIYRSTPVLIVDDGKRVVTKSGYHTAKQILATSGVQVYPEDKIKLANITDFASDNMVGRKLVITRAKPVQLILGGKTYNIRTQARSVQDLLRERGVSLNTDDLISVNKSSLVQPGDRIVINRISQDTVVVNSGIAADTTVTYDDTLEYGKEKVQTAGSDGVMQTTYLVAYKDKKETSRSILEQKVVKNPVTRVIVRGKKVNEDIWFRLRMCESGNDYTKNTGNGFYGAYQFADSTWDKYNTGYATANLAPPDVQDRTAKLNIALSAGGFWSQHPGCSRILKLPQKP